MFNAFKSLKLKTTALISAVLLSAGAASLKTDAAFVGGPYPYYEGARGPVIVEGPRWAYLGQTTVDFRGEQDSIVCDPQQTWRRLQLTVSDGAVELCAMRVNFLHPRAAPYDVPVQRQVLTRDHPSIVIELPGEVRRNVTRVDFSYRAVDSTPRPTRLTVTGQ